MNEANLMRQLQVFATQLGARVLRNNVGLGFAGKPQHIRSVTTATLYPGDVVLRKAAPIKFGLGVGSSDLIGWLSVTVTQEMVGKTFARFVALEVKTEDGKPTEEQIAFIDAIVAAGGIASIVRNEQDLKKLLSSET